LIGDSKACKARKSWKPHLEGVSADEECNLYGEDGNDTDEKNDEQPVNCCMRWLLLHQSDFADQKSQLEFVHFSSV
jgi:hypothetical protein